MERVRTARRRRDRQWRPRTRRSIERRIIAATAISLLFLMQFGLIFGVGQFKLLGVLIGIALVVLTRRNPMPTARLAIVWIPMGPVLLSLMLRVGAPVQLVATGTYIRSGLILSLALAAWGRRRASGRPLDRIDGAGLGYLVVVVVYVLIAPFIESSPLTFSTRLQGVQSISMFVVAFLAVRWLDLTREERASLRRWVTGMILFLALTGIYQRFDQGGFNRIIYEQVDLDRYFREVAKLDGVSFYNATRYYFEQPLRVMSFTQNPFAFSDLMLCGIGLGLVGLTRRPRPLDAALLGFGAVGVFLCGNRISIVAAGCMMATAFASRGVSELAKVRFTLIGVFAVIALLPMLLSSRLIQGAEYDTTSNDEHFTEITQSIEAIVDRPIGGGVGSDAFVSRRAAVTSSINSGNTLLGIGIQMGILGLGVFMAFFVGVVARAREHDPDPDGGNLLATLLLVGSFVSGMTHNSWQDPASGPVTWLLIGLGIGAARTARPRWAVTTPARFG
jgi:hypothetical protein